MLALLVMTWLVAMGSMPAPAAEPLPTAIRYQGRLTEAGAPANGQFDLRFALFTEPVGGQAYGPLLTQTGVAVSNGLFAVLLDFGSNVLAGSSSWLEVSVRAGGSGESAFISLAPRQLLSPVPYALYTLKAESVVGPVSEAQLPPTVARLNQDLQFTGKIAFTGPVGIGTTNPAAPLDVRGEIRASNFRGNGAGLSNVVATGVSARWMQRLWRVPIPFVTVTNAGNAPDPTTGKGAVPYPYRIGKFEVNNRQYVAFLNAVAADDPNGLYDTNMTASVYGGILRSGAPGDFTYAVKPGLEHQPVVWVDYGDILRFCNWLHHGQPAGAQDETTTEDGAYTVTADAILNNALPRNPGARFWIPSDDEWYKAAYHQPIAEGGDLDDYWLYPTRSNTPPVSEPPPGWDNNSANVCCETGRTSTDVGAYTSAASYYGTFDQAGGVEEWTEEIIFVTNRRLRGGSWNYSPFYAKSTDFEFDTLDYDGDAIGFRVAGAVD